MAEKYTEGAKHDKEKTRLDLVSPIAIEKIGKIMMFGVEKYGEHNWRVGIKWSRLIAASLRHIYAYLRGEDHDKETGRSHLAHAACCLHFLLEYEETHRELDDRYKLPCDGRQ